ncbi:MAG TPA: hypothetical protein PLX97_01160 [Gemmatales bacterium]|nr:hypothetical protein [Gemmatales bacterium]
MYASHRIVLLLLGLSLALFAGAFVPATPAASLPLSSDLFAAAPRWWDETVQWIRSLGWDRGRLVQLWLLFVLIGLYIILRIKPRA